MTTQYALKAGNLTATTLAAAVGKTYNIGLSDGTHYYGYNLQNWGTQTRQRRLYGASVQDGFVENSDITTRGALTNFGSPNLVDRDLVYIPRVSQGDFSGGGLQTVYIDPTRYYDSDLEVKYPGYLQLRLQQKTGFLTKTQGVANAWSIVPFNGQFWASVAANDFTFVSFLDPSTPTTATAGITVGYLCTEGYGLYYSDGSSIRRWIASETTIANTVNGTLGNLWVIQNGTGQYFAYYVNGTTPQQLWKVDLSNSASFPIAAASHVQVPTGGMEFSIVDLVAYNNGIAILTTDATSTSSGVRSVVWFHDGANMTQIATIEGFQSRGMCNCLGDLYITADQVFNNTGGSILARIAGGTYSVVAQLPVTTIPTTFTYASRPAAGDGRVYFLVVNSTVNGIAPTYAAVYDSTTGAFSHSSGVTNPGVALGLIGRSVAVLGSAFAVVGRQIAPTTWELAAQGAAGTYQGSGWMVSSNFDFSTPAIEKRFRTINVHHAPLATGESIKVNGYVDLDPVAFTTSLTPTATTTNSTVGSTTTTLSFGANVGVGHMLYYALQLTAGTSNLTSPRVNYVAIEVGGTWSWDLDLDCSVRRRSLTQQDGDLQGVGGKDLYYLLRNSYENGTLLTLYLAEGVTYTVNIETVNGNNVAYMDKPTDGSTINADDEWLCHVVLRQVI